MNLFVLNKDLEPITILDDYVSLIWTDRYRECGDFELTLATSGTIPGTIQQDYYLWSSNSEHVMIIEKLSITSDVDEGSTITISGRSLESILDRRVIWGLKTLSGNLQNGVQELLNENVISPSNESRKIDNFVFEASTDSKITELAIDAQYTGDNLYDVICGICADRGIGFKVTLSEDKKFVFKLYAGTDRSYNQQTNPWVIFSPKFDNLISSNYLESRSGLKNVALVGGEGEGSARRYTAVGNAVGLERRELFTDARDISSDTGDGTTLSNDEYISLLRQRGKEDLAENVEVMAFEGEAETSQMFKYGEDFFNGDVVQVVNEYGHESPARILEIVMSENEEGTSVYPTFSVESYEALPKGYLRLSYIQSSGTQYFDTGFEPNQNTRVVMDIDIESLSTSYIPIFGARGISDTNAYVAWAVNPTTVRSDYGTELIEQAVSTVFERMTIDKNKSACSFGSMLVKNSEVTFQAPCSLVLLSANTNGAVDDRKLSAKIYSCKIYSNDILIRDFVPVKNDEDVVGLYDFVERKFYKNAGSGAFEIQS